MIRFFLSVLFMMTVASHLYAQEAPIEAPTGEIQSADSVLSEADYEQRLELSREMHEIWPIRPKVESALDNLVQQVEPQNRMQMKSALRKAIKFGALEEASIDAMADIFTEDELKAMIDFYGSKEGRSVSFKTDDYERALQPIMIKMIDKALLEARLGQ